MKYITTINDKEFQVDILDDRHILLDGTTYEVDFEIVGNQPLYSLIINGKSFEAYIYPENHEWQVLLHGRLYTAIVEDEREKRLKAAAGGKVVERGEFHLKAPMPGMVIAVPVKDGQSVEAGDVLVILESMKMQNELKSPKAGVVSRIKIHAGDSVEQNQTLLSVS
ncbi:MAG: biotin/lipoyl-containing protein [Anaerolineales bacterium]